MTSGELLNWRLARGLTKKAAAETLGISRNTYSRYERGITPVPLAIARSCWVLKPIRSKH